jgi:hypothetical protein
MGIMGYEHEMPWPSMASRPFGPQTAYSLLLQLFPVIVVFHLARRPGSDRPPAFSNKDRPPACSTS